MVILLWYQFHSITVQWELMIVCLFYCLISFYLGSNTTNYQQKSTNYCLIDNSDYLISSCSTNIYSFCFIQIKRSLYISLICFDNILVSTPSPNTWLQKFVGVTSSTLQLVNKVIIIIWFQLRGYDNITLACVVNAQK